MDPVFQRAAALESATRTAIFGVPLAPLTIGHLFLLTELDSPFADGAERKISWGDLVLAIFICSYPTHDKARTALKSRWLRLAFSLWGLRARAMDTTKHIDAFITWLAAEQASPEWRAPVDAQPGRAGSPACWLKLFFAMHILHMRREDALNLRVRESNALYAVWADWNGHVQLAHTPEWEDFWKLARIEDAKRFNADGTRRAALN